MRPLRPTLAIVLLLSACGDDSGGEDAGGGADAQSARSAEGCGTAGSRAADECIDFTACGGPSNVGRALCGSCPREALTQICVAGQCETYDRSGIIETGFIVNTYAKLGESYTVFLLDPETADGTRLSCSALLSSCLVLGNQAINVINVQVSNPLAGGSLQQDNSYIAPASAHVGSDRLSLVWIHSAPNGGGHVIAQGCAEGIQVLSGEKTRAVVELGPYTE